jgi:anthraniloyl-CoA monooxygenase
MQFTFQLLTRSGRITYDDLRLRDVHFVESIDRWFMRRAFDSLASEDADEELYYNEDLPIVTPPVVAPSIVAVPPATTPLRLQNLIVSNRIILSHPSHRTPACSPLQDGTLNEEYANRLASPGLSGAGLVMTDIVAVSRDGRITPDCAGLYEDSHKLAWEWMIAFFHGNTLAKLAIQLGHAGRRGSTRPRTEGLDRPLRDGNWPLLSASPLPYTPQSQVPKEMDRDDMQQVLHDFVRAAQMSEEAHIDMLQLHFGHGYLLASFLSPLTNRRTDDYGGDLQHRMRYPLEVFDAVRAVWPEAKPLSVALSATDCVKGGFRIEDAITFAQVLKEHGCDIIQVLAGQTTMDGEPAYGRGFLTSLSDRIRNEAGIRTMVGGYLTTSNEVNTILAAGRADLCLMDSPYLNDAAWATPINIELDHYLLTTR